MLIIPLIVTGGETCLPRIRGLRVLFGPDFMILVFFILLAKDGFPVVPVGFTGWFGCQAVARDVVSAHFNSRL